MKDKIIQFIKQNEWNYLEKDGIIKIDVDGEDISWSSYIKADEEYNFSYFAILPTKVSSESVLDITALLNKINTNLWFGNFEIITEEPNSGQVRFRTSCLIPPTADEKTTELLINTTINFNMATMNFYSKEIIKACFK